MENISKVEFLSEIYSDYKENSIFNRRISHKELTKLINKVSKKKIYKISKAGKSVEDRELYQIQTGKGETKVLLWSQMHGDESTATMAIFDILNFLSENSSPFRNEIFNNLKLYFLPMLNPDGAEKFQRRNALNIDLNRDALRLESPESKVLKSLRDKIKPEFGFNLHDQHNRYSVARSGRPVALAFLAPAPDFEKTITPTRESTMQVISDIYKNLNNFLPDNFARYDDAFEPRAFGDNMIKWETSSILIESGFWQNDLEKQYIRKLNFIAILTGLYSIATNEYKKYSESDYTEIPENKELFLDLKLTNVSISKNGNNYKVDIGINRTEMTNSSDKVMYYSSKIEDIGDLSTFSAHEEIDCTGLEIKPSKTFPEILSKISDIQALDLNKLTKLGYCSIVCESLKGLSNFTKFPFNILFNNQCMDYDLSSENYANFLLYKGKELKFICVNGFLRDPKKPEINIPNALVIR